MTYRPLGTKVTIRMKMRPKISAGGLYLPGKNERNVIGVVEAIGDEVKYTSVGDIVYYGAYDMKELEPDLYMMDEGNLIAKLEGDDDDNFEA